VLGFVFMIPMNFVIQSYGSTIMDERINRRGELMLVSPVSPTDIVVGKTLPYFLVLLGVTTGIALGLGVVLGASAGPLAVAAVMPIAILFLSATFVGAMFARSFKELTFVTVTVSVFLTSYAFIPAIFTDVTPIALISPLTIVVRDLQGAGVSVGEFVFSVAPPLLTGVILFALGAGVYREEDMFTQRPVHLKALDALAARIHRPRSVALWTALFIPFVLVAELLALALLWVLPVPVTVIGLLVCIAVIEEVAKSAHVFAGFEHARYDRSARTALLVGALSGLGFFLAEKALAVVQLVGIPSLRQGQGQPIFPAGSPGLDPLLVVALLLAPLALHTVTASLSALGARRNSRWWLAGMTAAVVVHVVYNYAVIGVIGGGL
jgi:ABC-type Na+ efflux pump permease subunit